MVIDYSIVVKMGIIAREKTEFRIIRIVRLLYGAATSPVWRPLESQCDLFPTSNQSGTSPTCNIYLVSSTSLLFTAPTDEFISFPSVQYSLIIGIYRMTIFKQHHHEKTASPHPLPDGSMATPLSFLVRSRQAIRNLFPFCPHRPRTIHRTSDGHHPSLRQLLQPPAQRRQLEPQLLVHG